MDALVTTQIKGIRELLATLFTLQLFQFGFGCPRLAGLFGAFWLRSPRTIFGEPLPHRWQGLCLGHSRSSISVGVTGEPLFLKSWLPGSAIFSSVACATGWGGVCGVIFGMSSIISFMQKNSCSILLLMWLLLRCLLLLSLLLLLLLLLEMLLDGKVDTTFFWFDWGKGWCILRIQVCKVRTWEMRGRHWRESRWKYIISCVDGWHSWDASEVWIHGLYGKYSSNNSAATILFKLSLERFFLVNWYMIFFLPN